VIATCPKPECHHEYLWKDSRETICPLCQHEPTPFDCMYFIIDTETAYANQEEIVQCICQCGAQIYCRDQHDCECPKCGGQLITYVRNNQLYCYIHQAPLKLYNTSQKLMWYPPPLTDMTFPYAKILFNESSEGLYCDICESLYRQWLTDYTNQKREHEKLLDNVS